MWCWVVCLWLSCEMSSKIILDAEPIMIAVLLMQLLQEALQRQIQPNTWDASSITEQLPLLPNCEVPRSAQARAHAPDLLYTALLCVVAMKHAAGHTCDSSCTALALASWSASSVKGCCNRPTWTKKQALRVEL